MISFANARDPVTLVRSPTLTKSESSPIASGSRPARRSTRDSGNESLRCRAREAPRRDARHRGGDRANVVGSGPAAAADEVDEPGARELAEQARSRLGSLVVAGVGHRVRQPRIRVAADEGVRDARKLLDVRAHQRRTERAVQADRE